MTSNINPNNINGAYPVAGQDNNSQGFRDNFTNTSTNFQYAADEITELQNKAVLKAAISGTTLDNNMQGSPLSNAVLSNMSETVVSLGTQSGSVTINYLLASYQTVTAGAPISLGFTNFPAAGTAGSVVVTVTVTNVSQTLQLPSSVGFGASATSVIGIAGLNTGTNTITFPAVGTYTYEFWTADSGTTVYINDLTQGRTSFPTTVTVTDLSATGNVTVAGRLTGNVVIDSLESVTGNVSAGNLNTAGQVVATGNITGNNISVGNVVSSKIQVNFPAFITISGTNTYSLSATNSISILTVSNTGYTATLNMPSTPIDGQICNFAVYGNTVTLATGTGTVTPSYAGSTTVGTSFRYVYHYANNTWYRI